MPDAIIRTWSYRCPDQVVRMMGPGRCERRCGRPSGGRVGGRAGAVGGREPAPGPIPAGPTDTIPRPDPAGLPSGHKAMGGVGAEPQVVGVDEVTWNIVPQDLTIPKTEPTLLSVELTPISVENRTDTDVGRKSN
jgi:hypothetical protein